MRLLSALPALRIKPLWSLIGVLLGAFAVGLSGINRDVMWLDELITSRMVLNPQGQPYTLGEVILTLVGDAVWPPLPTVSVYLWGHFAGWTAFAGRFLSLLIGVLAIAVMYRAGRQLFGMRAGLLSAVFLATAAFYLNYLHEMRGYVLYVLFTALTLWSYWRLVGPAHPPASGSRASKALLLLGLAGMLYSHYVAATAFVALGLFHVLFRRGHPNFRAVFSRFFAALLLYAPWIAVLVGGITVFSRNNPNIPIGLPGILTQSLYGFSNGLPLLVVLALVYVLAFRRDHAVGFVLFWAVVTFVLAILVDTRVHFLFHIRHIVFLLLAVILIITASLSRIAQRSTLLMVIVVFLWSGMGLWWAKNEDFMRGFSGHVRTIPSGFIETLQAFAAACATENDLLIASIDPNPANERLHTPILDHYLQPYGVPVLQPHQVTPVQAASPANLWVLSLSDAVEFHHFTANNIPSAGTPCPHPESVAR